MWLLISSYQRYNFTYDIFYFKNIKCIKLNVPRELFKGFINGFNQF